MNPKTDISPPMETNEGIRRLLNIFMDLNGKPRIGAPGGPVRAFQPKTVRVAATGPNPILASLIVPRDDTRVGGVLRNLDTNLTIWWGGDPTVTNLTGATLKAGENTPINIRGPIYIYCTGGAPLCEFTSILPE